MLDQAIKAAGGANKLKQLQRLTCKLKGVGVFPGDRERELRFTAHVEGFEHCRLDGVSAFGRDDVVMAVFNPESKHQTGWLDQPTDIKLGSTVILGAGSNHDMYAIRLAQLLVPLQGKAFELSSLGEHKIDKRLTVGLKFGHDDRPSLDLYFDKETGLPAKAQIQVPIKSGGMENLLPDEIFFDDWKELNGAKYFSKLTIHRDGKKRLELEVTDITPQESFDAKIFTKP